MLGAHSKNDLTGTEKYVKIKKTITHPKAYDFQKHKPYGHWVDDIVYYDYSLLLLEETIKYTAEIQPICLPTMGDQDYSKSLVFTSGWGYTKVYQDKMTGKSRTGMNSVTPKKVTLEVIDYKTCRDLYSLRGCKHCKQDTVLCTYGVNPFNKTVKEDACQGDSGGILDSSYLYFIQKIIFLSKLETLIFLLIHFYYKGPLFSMEENTATLIGVTSFGYLCGDVQYSAFFAKVDHVLDWIDSTIQKYSTNI